MKLPLRNQMGQFDEETIQKIFDMLMANDGPSHEEIMNSYHTTPNVLNDILSRGIERRKLQYRNELKEGRKRKVQTEINMHYNNDIAPTIGGYCITGHKIVDGKLLLEVGK